MWQRSFWLSFDKEVSDFPSSEDSSDEWLSEKLRNWNFHSEAANKSCSTKISVLQEPVLECSFFCIYSQKPEKIRVKEFIFSNYAGLQPATLLKTEFLYT